MKKRLWITIGLLALLAISSIQLVSAQAGGFVTTITQRANMRSGPDSSHNLIQLLDVGTPLNIDGRNENAHWVRGITPGGAVGWVASGTIQITIPQLHSLPIIGVDTPFTLPPPAAAAPPPAAPGAEPTGDGTLVTAVANSNVRVGPGTSFRRVAGLQLGQPFNVDGRNDAGDWVRGITPGGTVGWVFASLLSFSGNQVGALPVVTPDTPFGLGAPGAGPAPAAAPAVTTGPVRGFSYGGHIQSLNQRSIDAMRRSGMTWIKQQWRYVDGQNPNSAAGLINQAHQNGFRIMLGVIGANPGDINNPGYFDRYASFVAGLAGHGADAIEIWNEPNIDREWPAGQISPARYTDLLRISYNAIKSANPNTLVVSGAPAPTGFFGGCSGGGCDDNAFLHGMAAAGAANYMDCIGIHYNEGILPPTATSGDPRGASGHYTRYFGPMMNTYYNAFGGARPLCFTEMGYLTPQGFPPLPPAFAWAQNVSVAQQASWLRQAIDIARNSGRVRVFIIWNVDFTRYDHDPMAGYAMIRPDGSCPACDALGR
jgi:uncharacterized protein YraI